MVDKKEASVASFSTRFDMHVGCGCTVRVTDSGAIFIAKPRIRCNVAEKARNTLQLILSHRVFSQTMLKQAAVRWTEEEEMNLG
jgi:hypothetical protein